MNVGRETPSGPTAKSRAKREVVLVDVDMLVDVDILMYVDNRRCQHRLTSIALLATFFEECR